jgi:glutathione reductase (NADPH)
MSKSYDLAIIGTGTAAAVAATRVRAAGWRVAVVDFRPFGGTCALRGCDPKKLLIGGAAAVEHARRMRDKGVIGDTRIDWPALMAFKRSFTDSIPAARERRYAQNGIDAYRGRARFTGPSTLAVGNDVLEAEHILIAAGAEPVKLGIPGEEHLITNEEFLSLEQLPGRIVLVGGGYIAAEFSHIAAAAGAQVTILHRGERLLKHFDPDLVGWLTDKFRALGVEVRTGAAVEAIEPIDTGYRVHASSEAGRSYVDADCVIHAAGRRPDLAALDLEAANVAMQDGTIALNDYLQSLSNPAVYAAGDAALKGPPLTPVASHDAKVVAENLLHGNRRKPDYTGVPNVAFSAPPIASVGLSERAARERGVKLRVNLQKAPDWFTARQAAESVYGFKTLIDDDNGEILGAHIVGPHADEVINLFALAIRNGLTADDLKSTMFAYPTGASDISYMV